MIISGSDIYRLSVSDVKAIFDILVKSGYQNIGPVARDGAIMLDDIESFDDIAKGFQEEQGRGSYRLNKGHENSLFNYSVGPQSFKNYLSPPRRKLWSASGSKQSFQIEHQPMAPRMAFWGVRNCDLESIQILDRVFLEGSSVNQWYKSARKNLLLISVACTHPSDNCFCSTMNGGPLPMGNFDISFLEVFNDFDHYFLTEFKSERVIDFPKTFQYEKAKADEMNEGRMAVEKAEEKMGFRFIPEDASEMLRNNPEHKQWSEIAERCLGCANCTMVCPTCFCTTIEDVIDLTGNHTERWIKWDTCFDSNFSYLHGGPVRTKISSRYRQWMNHKFSTWYDQFGSAGCVGCGRCIAWCPIGIDITEEIQKMEESV